MNHFLAKFLGPGHLVAHFWGGENGRSKSILAFVRAMELCGREKDEDFVIKALQCLIEVSAEQVSSEMDLSGNERICNVASVVLGRSSMYSPFSLYHNGFSLF